MNRIILIGNGFDLAHEMKTSYKDFLENLCNKYIKEINDLFSQNIVDEDYENEAFYIESPKYQWESVNSFDELTDKGIEINYKNIFLKYLIETSEISNWIDIESAYYDILKNIYLNKKTNYSITNLNNDFSIITNYLKVYLTEIENKSKHKDYDLKIKKRFKEIIFSDINYNDFTLEIFNKKINEVESSISKKIELFLEGKLEINKHSEKTQNLIIKISQDIRNGGNITKSINNILSSKFTSNFLDLTPNDILFLNFNYTGTQHLYDTENEESIHIHGSLRSEDKNPIIFGFGDEIDDDYKAIENLNNNEYLDNIKSIKYLETDNYRKLLEYINSSEYQIFILGHSCGISDRTLLNTIFEHKNCVSIKTYFHQISKTKDNFSDLIKNISRNFNKNTEMRKKVVNKKFCEALFPL